MDLGLKRYNIILFLISFSEFIKKHEKYFLDIVIHIFNVIYLILMNFSVTVGGRIHQN